MKTNDSQPTFVLERIYEIMKENNITDNRKVGLYGLTYKENVDDFRESPALQLLDIQQRHLARPLKYKVIRQHRWSTSLQFDSA